MTRALFIILFAFMALQPARAADVCDGLDGAAAEGCMDIVKQHGTIGKQFLACLKQYGDDPRCSKFPEVDPKSGADAYCHALKLDGESYQSCLEHPELWTWGPEYLGLRELPLEMGRPQFRSPAGLQNSRGRLRETYLRRQSIYVR